MNGSLFLSVDVSKEGISDISCYGQGLSFKFFQVVKGGAEVSPEPSAKVAFSSEQSTGAQLGVSSSEPPPPQAITETLTRI